MDNFVGRDVAAKVRSEALMLFRQGVHCFHYPLGVFEAAGMRDASKNNSIFAAQAASRRRRAAT